MSPRPLSQNKHMICLRPGLLPAIVNSQLLFLFRDHLADRVGVYQCCDPFGLPVIVTIGS